jgi:hypothetical protein
MKQETLEEYEAAIIKFPEYDQFLERIGFDEGAKWQQERSYSEEDMILLIQFLSMNIDFNGYGSVSKETAKFFLRKYKESK